MWQWRPCRAQKPVTWGQAKSALQHTATGLMICLLLANDSEPISCYSEISCPSGSSWHDSGLTACHRCSNRPITMTGSGQLPSCLLPDPGRDLRDPAWQGRRISYWICERKDVTAIVFKRNAKQGEAAWFMAATKLCKTDLKHNSCIWGQNK